MSERQADHTWIDADIDVTATPTPTQQGTRLADRYEILGLIGVGGMGSVYRARDLTLDEDVALKVIRPELTGDAGVLGRFRQEVKLARMVTHRNVVRTFDLGEDGDLVFLTMEYVEGKPLSRILQESGPLPLGRAIYIANGICAGIGAAHQAGVLHRDLKPDNVLIGEGRVAITDFGIARARVEASLVVTLTGTVGTPAYMAPEQIDPDPAAPLDGRADLYALGAILFEMVTGKRAWKGSGLADALQRMNSEAPDPRLHAPDLPDPVVDVIRKAMARDPDRRHPTAQAFAAALRAITPTLEGELTAVPHHSVPQRTATSVAVLPFSFQGPPDQSYVAEGLTEEIIDGLSMSDTLRVRALSSVAGARTDDPLSAGRSLEVDVVVSGALRVLGEQMRLSVRVLNVSDGFRVWANRYKGPLADMLDVTDQAGVEIARALTVEVSRNRSDVQDPIAVDLYLRGRHEMRERWYTDIEPATQLLSQAVERAPDDPRILASYALCLARQMFNIQSGVRVEEGAPERAADRAIAAAPHLADPWLASAYVRLNVMDVAGAVGSLRAALDRAPNLAKAQQLLGMLLCEAADLDEGLMRLRTAKTLDPEERGTAIELSRILALLGDWEQSDKLYEAHGTPGATLWRARRALWNPARYPPVPRAERTLESSGDLATILVSALEDVRRTGEVPALLRTYLSQPMTIASLRMAALTRQFAAEVQAYVGEDDDAVASAREAIRLGCHDLLWVQTCPVFERLRGRSDWAEVEDQLSKRAARVLAR